MTKDRLKNIFFQVLIFITITGITTFGSNKVIAYESGNDSSVFIKKMSKSYTKKFCNSIAFGLSKESAMNFSIEENKKVFIKKKEFNNLNKDLLAEEIAIAVVEECGYPINFIGEEGIQNFKNYYLTKDKEI